MKSIAEQFFNQCSEDIGEVVVLSCFDRLDDFKRRYNKHLRQEFEGYYKGITLDFEGRRISVIYSGSGASRVGDAMLALNGSNCKAAIYTGTAGGIGENISIGDMVIPDKAVAGEGLSRYYIKDFSMDMFKNICSPSPEMLQRSVDFFSRKIKIYGKPHFSKLFTIESIFAESEKFLQTLTVNNCSAIDMETSAFFTASSVAKINCLAVHYISDLPAVEQDYDMFKKACIRSYIKMPHMLVDFIIEYFDEIIAKSKYFVEGDNFA